jgi:voltage-gated potassium channel
LKTAETKNWRTKLHDIIYEVDTPMGKAFDLALLILIVLSIIFVMLESVKSFDEKYHEFLYIGEWVITIFFSLEYIARIITVKKPTKYIFSFYGIIDLLSTIPLYLSFIPGFNYLLTVRALRLLRIFRILKVTRYIGASNKLKRALLHSRPKIFIFLFAVVIISIIAGTIMYIVEGEEHGFSSIPHGIYWAIVTLTTVGYGDVSPGTPLGQFIASLIMIMGYGIIAVPTGIITSEYTKADQHVDTNTKSCTNCNASHHGDNAKFCNACGHTLYDDEDLF